MRTEAIYSVCCSNGVSLYHLPLAETQKQAGEWESFSVKKREGSRCALFRGCWLGEAGGRLIRSRASHVIGEHTWLSVVGPELGIGTKNRETISF